MGENTERRLRRGAIWQQHELWYVIDRLQEQFPEMTREAIAQIVDGAKEDVPRAKGGDALAQHVSKKLR